MNLITAIAAAMVINMADELLDDGRLAKALTPPPFKEPTQAQKDAGVTWQDLNKPDARSIHKDSK